MRSGRLRARIASPGARLALCVVWMLFIWGHSMMPGDASSQESGFFVDLLAPHLTPIPFTVHELTLLVRKLAHMGEYAVLAILAARAHLPNRRALFLATVLLTPVADEIIQLFTPGRAGMAIDVLIDLAGVCIGYALWRFACARRAKSEQNG